MGIPNMHGFVVAAIAVVTIAISVIAAAECSAGRNLSVDDSTLDLTRRSGILRLYRRLQDAAMHACDPSSEGRVLPYYNRPDYGDCYADKLYAAMQKYDNAALTKIHDEFRREPIIVGDNF